MYKTRKVVVRVVVFSSFIQLIKSRRTRPVSVKSRKENKVNKKIGIMKMLLYLRSINHQKQSNLKKTFYLITEKNYIHDNILDVGVFIEKIVLSTETEDYKEFIKETSPMSERQLFNLYVESFQFYIHDELEREKRKSQEEECQIYNQLLLDEEQYKLLMKQTSNIPTREISVLEICE